MKIFHIVSVIRPDPFKIAPGSQRLAVGAPHHGTHPQVEADLGTGPICLALAAQLGARAVVASDLRRIVDVNKSPLGLDKAVRLYAIRYQNELFCELPRLVIEIHGHISGKYDIEISTGFDLDPAIPADGAYLEKLHRLREALPGAVASRAGLQPTVGIYPLNPDVHNAATSTFTFQKIRRARNLAGLEWFGLHIELSAAFRTSKQSRSPAFVESLGATLATAISETFGSNDLPQTFIPTRAEPGIGIHDSGEGVLLKIQPVPQEYALQPVVLLNPGDLERLGVLDSDRLILSNGDESIQAAAMTSQAVRSGQAGLPERLRSQINLKLHQLARVSAAAPPVPGAANHSVPYLALGAIRPQGRSQVWIAPGEIDRLRLGTADVLQLKGLPVTLQSDPSLPCRVMAVSKDVAEKLVCTIGEVLPVVQSNGKF